MQWLELSVLVPQEAVEAVAAVFYEIGNGGVAIEESIVEESDQIDHRNALRPVLVRTYVPLDAGAEERRLRAEESLWHLGQIMHVGPLETRVVSEDDWAESWKIHHSLQHIGQRLVVKPSWQGYVASGDEIVIELDPGMAFGTGLHPTTRMCLVEIERRLQPGSTVLDLGTGSGILALAAAKLGASYVLAMDIDPIAVEVAKANVKRNGVEGIVAVAQGSLDQGAEHEGQMSAVTRPAAFDFVVANLLAETIIDLAASLTETLHPGGLLVASGIIEPRLSDVTQALSQGGFSVIDLASEGDWRTIIAARR